MNVADESEAAECEFMVVARVDGFDMSTNDEWNLEDSKSFPRDGIVCFGCKEPVVMSNFLFGVYSKEPHPERIICAQCLLVKLEKENAS